MGSVELKTACILERVRCVVAFHFLSNLPPNGLVVKVSIGNETLAFQFADVNVCISLFVSFALLFVFSLFLFFHHLRSFLFFLYYFISLFLSFSFLLSWNKAEFFRIWYTDRTPLWSSGQSSWLQIQRPRIRFQTLPDFLRSSGSGNGVHSAS
jgi:hypothetical protein